MLFLDQWLQKKKIAISALQLVMWAKLFDYRYLGSDLQSTEIYEKVPVDFNELWVRPSGKILPTLPATTEESSHWNCSVHVVHGCGYWKGVKGKERLQQTCQENLVPCVTLCRTHPTGMWRRCSGARQWARNCLSICPQILVWGGSNSLQLLILPISSWSIGRAALHRLLQAGTEASAQHHMQCSACLSGTHLYSFFLWRMNHPEIDISSSSLCWSHPELQTDFYCRQFSTFNH